MNIITTSSLDRSSSVSPRHLHRPPHRSRNEYPPLTWRDNFPFAALNSSISSLQLFCTAGGFPPSSSSFPPYPFPSLHCCSFNSVSQELSEIYILHHPWTFRIKSTRFILPDDAPVSFQFCSLSGFFFFFCYFLNLFFLSLRNDRIRNERTNPLIPMRVHFFDRIHWIRPSGLFLLSSCMVQNYPLWNSIRIQSKNLIPETHPDDNFRLV